MARRPPPTSGPSSIAKALHSAASDLPTQNVDTISAALESRQVDAGEVIVRQGGPADKFFIIVDGEVEVIRDVDGQEQPIALLSKGHFFGEIAIMRDAPREATVRAKTPTTLLSLDRASFRDLVAQSLGTTADFDQVIKARLKGIGAQA